MSRTAVICAMLVATLVPQFYTDCMPWERACNAVADAMERNPTSVPPCPPRLGVQGATAAWLREHGLHVCRLPDQIIVPVHPVPLPWQP